MLPSVTSSSAELIDQTAFNPEPEYAFRHPLIRAVAYESQLKSDRAQLHKRVAAAIEQDDQNSALIAEHLEAAGELPRIRVAHAGGRHGRSSRDIAAAQHQLGACASRSPMRFRRCAQPSGEAHRAAHADMRQHVPKVPPGHLRPVRGTARPVHRGRRQGVVGDGYGRHDGRACAAQRCLEASRLASEYMALVESIGRPMLTRRSVVRGNRCQAPNRRDRGRLAVGANRHRPRRRRIRSKAAFIFGSPLATALAWRGVARFQQGVPGWRDDFDEAMAIAEQSDACRSRRSSLTSTRAYREGYSLADEPSLREIESVLQAAPSDPATTWQWCMLRLTFGIALIHNGEDRRRGYDILRSSARNLHRGAIRVEHASRSSMLYLARRTGGAAARRSIAIQQWRALADEMINDGKFRQHRHSA